MAKKAEQPAETATKTVVSEFDFEVSLLKVSYRGCLPPDLFQQLADALEPIAQKFRQELTAAMKPQS